MTVLTVSSEERIANRTTTRAAAPESLRGLLEQQQVIEEQLTLKAAAGSR